MHTLFELNFGAAHSPAHYIATYTFPQLVLPPAGVVIQAPDSGWSTFQVQTTTFDPLTGIAIVRAAPVRMNDTKEVHHMAEILEKLGWTIFDKTQHPQ